MREEKITQVVEIKYIADDGKEFHSKEKCMEYEQSDMFLAKKELKLLNVDMCDRFFGNDAFDTSVEVYDIQTEKDLLNLTKYITCKLKANGASNKHISEMFTSVDGIKRKDFALDNITIGHEVIICWNSEDDWCYTYRDGSIEGYFQYVRDCMKESFDSYKGNESKLYYR